MEILVIFTCYNRKEKTERCMKMLVNGNRNSQFTFVVVDDNSTDGTPQMLQTMREKEKYNIHLLKGDGTLFYSGGMRLGMEYALENLSDTYEYILIINDDVEFFDSSIEKMVMQSRQQCREGQSAVIVGVMCSSDFSVSYSAIKYDRGIRYRVLSTDEWDVPADTFHANTVLIPYDVFLRVGAMDSHYIHTLGDFDYGFSLKREGCVIYPSKEYVGMCEGNSDTGGWRDVTLSRKERIRQKERAKGAPTKQWFYFLKKNFGIRTAVKGCVTPYIRILIGK